MIKCFCDWLGEAVDYGDNNIDELFSIQYVIEWEFAEESIKHCYIWQTLILKSNFYNDINKYKQAKVPTAEGFR